MIRLIALCLSVAWLSAADKWDGSLQATIAETSVKAGAPATVVLAAVDGKGTPKPGVISGREAAFVLLPYRWSLFEANGKPLTGKRSGPDRFTLDLPKDLATGWYLLVTVVADDDGRLLPVGDANARHIERTVVAIRGADAGGAFLRVHAERGRCVFSPGERLRLFASARGKAGVAGAVTLGLLQSDGTVMPLASGAINAPAGAERTLAFDLDPQLTAAIAPGDYHLVAALAGKETDRLPVRFVAAERPSGGGRWAHTMPHGTSPGFDGSAVLPERLADGSYGGHSVSVVAGIHRANLWVNFFANSWPINGPDQALPEAGAADLPPTAAEYRPSLTHAFYQRLMADGVALGIFMGYGEDYKAEVYMPLPTIDQRQMAVLARKYVAGSVAASTLPNFVAAYTDAYGHMDWSGGGELSGEELSAIRDSYWEQACAAAGIAKRDKPLSFEFERKEWPDAFKDQLKDKAKGEAYDAFIAGKKEAGGDDWLKAYDSEAKRLALWQEAWKAAGATAPQPERRVPLPELDDLTTQVAGRDAAYRYASFVLRGIERCYGRITGAVERELPAVFTIHNQGTMNHSKVSHAWTGFRTPNIDPAYTVDGASAISVSEWNLDAVPKPYFLPTFYQQNLVDRGIPVYQCGLWKQMGSPTRFLRDGVFWMGRGIQTYFDQAENMTWSHIGADQTTYASNERMRAVSEFLSAYSDLVPRLQPVREVGLYVPPVGGPWGTGTTRGHYVGMLAALMSGWQVHMVSHADLATPEGLGRYPVIWAPAINGPDAFYPFEIEAFKRYVAAGGKIVGSQAPDYYTPEAVYTRFGISMKRVQATDAATGEPQRNKDGSPKMVSDWTATPDQWAKLTREYIWGALKDGVTVAPIDVNLLFTHRDAAGKPATWNGSHWTGHHEWAKYRGSALDQHPALAKVLAAAREPLVRKDKPEVFVDVTTPRGGGAGWWVFASNWTLPDAPDLYTQRVPQGFFNSMVKPVSCRLALKLPTGSAVYDLIAGKRLDTAVENGRIAFTADFAAVEGRVYAVTPEPIASAVLMAPASAAAGSRLSPRFELRGTSGKSLGVLGAVRVEVCDAAGAVLETFNRALPVDGTLPPIDVPARGERFILRVTDLIAGFTAESAIAVSGRPVATTAAADPVTVHRGDQVHGVLRSEGLVIAWDAGAMEFKDGASRLVAANPQAARDKAWAERLAKALTDAGLRCRAAATDTLVTGPMYAHPWTGGMAHYRQRHTVPDVRIDAPVVLVGDPTTSPVLAEMERSWVAGRSIGRDNVGPGRAVIAFQPLAFHETRDAVIVAATDDAGVQAAAAILAGIAKTKPAVDPTYAAREQVRFRWLPAEVELAKQRKGLAPAPVAAGAATGMVETAAKTGSWSGMQSTLGQAVVVIDATPGGVVVGTKSWDSPTVLVSPTGAIVGAWGGGAEVTPRDVGVSLDGKTAWAGYSLMGRVAAYQPGKTLLVKETPVVMKENNPFEWDSFKDSDRHLGMSPDHSVALAPLAGGITAFDPATGAERWKIAGVVGTGDVRGQAHPEFGFSADGKVALVSPMVDGGTRSIKATLRFNLWDASAKRYDKKTEDREVVIPVRVQRRELHLVDTATGKALWKRLIGVELVDAKTGDLVWNPGRQIQWRVTDPATDNKPRTYKAVEADAVPLDATSGQPVEFEGLLDLAMWHLYTAIGPKGVWTVCGTRDAVLALLDDQGQLLRRFSDRELPKELDPGSMIPPVVLPSRDPEKVLVFAPQSRAAFLMRIVVGSAEVRKKARALADENQALMRRIRAVINDGKGYGRFDDKAWMDGFASEIAAVPADLKGELLGQMGRVSGEARAGRRRNAQWFSTIIERIDRRLYEEDAAALNAAVALQPVATLRTDALISDVRCDAQLGTAYIACWDGTVRAVATADGKERWRTQVVGGSRLALALSSDGSVQAIYAGGSRGDLSRIDLATGAVAWTVNVGAVSSAERR